MKTAIRLYAWILLFLGVFGMIFGSGDPEAIIGMVMILGFVVLTLVYSYQKP